VLPLAGVFGSRRALLRVDRRVARRQTRWELFADVSARTLTVVHDVRVLTGYRMAVGARLSRTRAHRRCAGSWATSRTERRSR
jgi:hypothetical protein